MPPHADDLSQSQEAERGRLETERNWQLRQENILPLETAWNEGRFYGLVLKGSQRFTGVQRAGIFVLGLLAIGFALAMFLALARFHGVGPSLKSIYQRLPDVSLLSMPFILLEFALGFRFCWVALKRPPHNPNHIHTSHPHHHAK